MKIQDSKVETIDPHLSTYIYVKKTNPKAPIVWRQYERRLVDSVDRLVELAHGERDLVKSLKDWEIVIEIVKFFADEWPDEWNSFKATIPDIRHTRREGGYSETGEIKYVGAIPPRLMRMIKAIFPLQEFDKRFVNKFVSKFPLFKVGGEQNMGGGGIIIR